MMIAVVGVPNNVDDCAPVNSYIETEVVALVDSVANCDYFWVASSDYYCSSFSKVMVVAAIHHRESKVDDDDDDYWSEDWIWNRRMSIHQKRIHHPKTDRRH